MKKNAPLGMSEMKWKEFPQQPELFSSILVLHMGEETLFLFFFFFLKPLLF